MTKEEVFYSVMDNWGKQEAIAFAKFVDTEGYTQLDEDKWGSFSRELTTEQLWGKYLEHINQIT